MRCIHEWGTRQVKRGHIVVTILSCSRCGRTLVQTYPKQPASLKEDRLEAASIVRAEILIKEAK